MLATKIDKLEEKFRNEKYSEIKVKERLIEIKECNNLFKIIINFLNSNKK